MISRNTSGFAIALLTWALLPLPAASAQPESGIAGVVRDTSRAVLPGVTVEAASPALIEKVRTVVTDSEGRYNLVALAAGTYTVVFRLSGFRTVQRPGIVLTAGFTATVDAELEVGALEETITVTGASPMVDTRNVLTQTAVSDEMLQRLPIGGTSVSGVMVSMTPGMTVGGLGATDIGGSSGAFFADFLSATRYHGQSDPAPKSSLDGMRINGYGGSGGAGGAGYVTNISSVEEITLETSGSSAESTSSGMESNAIPRSGSNTFTIQASQMYTNGNLQSNNRDESLTGLAVPTELVSLWYVTMGIGGPIMRDKLWFYTTPRWDYSKANNASRYFNLTHGTPYYTPDITRPAYKSEEYRSTPIRLTWQVSSKDKVSTFFDYQPYCGCARDLGEAGEANNNRVGHTTVAQGTWQRPVTSRLLLQAGGSMLRFRRDVVPLPVVLPEHISIRDSQLGLEYNAGTDFGPNPFHGTLLAQRWVQRFSVSYVTGSHAFKVGVQNDFGSLYWQALINQDVSYIFRGSSPGAATPLSVIQYASPLSTKEAVNADLGLYVQDQWAVKRLTLNLGLRFDYLNAYVPAQHVPAVRYVGARDFAEVPDAPDWKDLSPRLGAAYDLFGNGRTALKLSLNKYMFAAGTNVANALNPLGNSSNQVTRDWNDRNGDYVPDCDLHSSAANGECGQWQDLNFGGTRNLQQWADDARYGFGVRNGMWDLTAEVQQQLASNVSMVVGYYRNWLINPRATDNLLVVPGDYSPFSITAPVDPRLPDGGGYTVSGLYDINPTKLGQVANLVTQASNFGKARLDNDFIAVNFRARFDSGIQLGGGVDTGRSVADSCFVVDSPEQLRDCRIVTGFKDQTQVKLYGTYPLPGGFQLSAIYNNYVGPVILANRTVTRAQIEGLDRPLSTSSRIVSLITPNTQYEPRITRLDVLFGWTFRLGRVRIQPEVGFYNALNGNDVVARNNTYGPQWGPQELMNGRLTQFSWKLNF